MTARRCRSSRAPRLVENASPAVALAEQIARKEPVGVVRDLRQRYVDQKQRGHDEIDHEPLDYREITRKLLPIALVVVVSKL